MPRHQHLDNRGLRVVLTAAGRGRAPFIWRLLGVGYGHCGLATAVWA